MNARRLTQALTAPTAVFALALSATVLLTLGSSIHAAMFFSEDFDDGTLDANLEQNNAGSWNISGGDATTGSRNYIRTVDTDYNTVDFVAEITVTINADGLPGNNGNGAAYFGLGDGAHQGDFWDAPTEAVVFELFPDSFDHEEFVGMIYDGDESGNSVYGENFWNIAESQPHNGTHRLRLSKSADVLTFEIDEFFTGTFSADDSTTISLNATGSNGLEHLDSSNSRIFFGTGYTTTSFDDFKISIPPKSGTIVFTH
jgi:hypothetical protein